MSFVQRWGIVRRVREQSVAEHMYYVAIYAAQTADLIKYQGNRANLYKAALTHDLPEGGVGDIMGPAKRAAGIGDALKKVEKVYMQSAFGDWPELQIVNQMEEAHIKLIVKFADILDEAMYLATEMQMGNSSIGSFYKEGIVCPARQVYCRLQEAWSNLYIHKVGETSFKEHEDGWKMINRRLNHATEGNSFIIANPGS